MNLQNNVNSKQISVNMIANIVSYSTNILIAFFLTPYLIEKLGKETYSFYPMANTIINYMAILMNAMNSVASRFVTVSLVQYKKIEANKYFSSTLFANVLLSVIVSVPLFLFIYFIDDILNVPINSLAAVRMLFSFMFCSSLIQIASNVFGIATFAKNRIDLRSIREIVISVSRLVLYILFYSFFPASISYIGITIFITSILNLIIQVFYTKMLLPEFEIKKSLTSFRHIKDVLISSSWAAINSLGNQLLVGLLLILSNVFYGASVSGVYSIVNTVPQFFSGIISMLIGVFYPVITYKYAQGNKKELIQSINFSQNMVGLVGCSIAIVFLVFSKEFYELWTPSEDALQLSKLTFVIVIPYFFTACMWTLTNVNIILNKIKGPAIFTLFIGVLNVFLSYLSYKMRVDSIMVLPLISTLLQILLIGIFIPLYVAKCLKVTCFYLYKPLFKALLVSLSLIVLYQGIKHYIIIHTWFDFLLVGGMFGIFTLIIMALVLFRGYIDLKKFLNNKNKCISN